MPSNFKIKKYVLGFNNSDFLSFDFQYNIIESAKYLCCSTSNFCQYKNLKEAQNAIISIKNKVKNIPDFFFYSLDNCYSLDKDVESKSIDDFYIIKPDEEECFIGCKYLKLPFTIDDLKIFSREIEVTYTEVTENI